MSFSLSDIKVMTLPQLTGGQDWRLLLAQDRPHHLLIWITRGQGRALLDGQRRGGGAHFYAVGPRCEPRRGGACASQPSPCCGGSCGCSPYDPAALHVSAGA